MSGFAPLPVLLVFAALLALPLVGGVFRSTYGLPVPAEKAVRLADALPVITSGDQPVAVSFGIASCHSTCPQQQVVLRRLAAAATPFRSYFVQEGKGARAGIAEQAKNFHQVELPAHEFASALRQISGKPFSADTTQHDSAIYVFAPDGRLRFIYPFLQANAARIAEDIRGKE